MTKSLLFTSKDCGGCRNIKPVIDELKKEGYDIDFVAIDTDEGLEIAQEQGVMGIPSLLIGDVLFDKSSLSPNKEVIKELFNKVETEV